MSRLAFKNASVLALGCVGARLSTGGAQFAAPGSLDAARLAYFAASVVWRGDAASSVPECSLGAHAEPFRLYLNGQKPFPRTATVSLGVLRDDEVQWEQVAELISLPQSQHKGQEDSHEFALCGLYFTVLTGNYSPATCLAGPSPLVELVSRSEFLRWLAPGLQGLEFIGRQPVVHGKT